MSFRTGNTHAVKHGLYSKRFSPAEKAALGKLDPHDLAGEIAMLRVRVDRATAVLDAETDPEAIARLLLAISAAVTTIGGLVRTHALLTGKYAPLDEAVAEVLGNVQHYLPADAPDPYPSG